jgi:hypothetical protein
MEKMIKWLINPRWPPIHKMYSKMLQKLTTINFAHYYYSQTVAGLKDTLLLITTVYTLSSLLTASRSTRSHPEQK